jgi:hypothetical protein
MKEYLPVGSVVRLKGASKRLVIAGIIQMEENKQETLHDYMGVPYPEGFVGPGYNFLFNHEDIDDVVFTGYTDEEREYFFQILRAAEASNDV